MSNPAHDERTRAKIKTSQIINRLEKLINGDVEMSSQQVTATMNEQARRTSGLSGRPPWWQLPESW